ncbi:hypothetical protein [Luteibacter yeojuensis]|uniref:ATP-grasp domain-containing protein n=1 Tax=Luteibacter yeojuensis TaxID=345309 RepID=A0A0F3K0B3_9GAMM|nr:hypothetical protein [Luteibacter yeojuensis]KJV24710.1 hypothetical protein VI08_20340 [Luteibacter yeojuensis]
MQNVEAGRVPAIVMGRGPTALGILRSLAVAGIPAYVACPPDDLTARSRWYRPTPGEPWDGKPGPQALEALRAMPLERAVIIPGADDAAMWLADLPATDLGHRFLVSSSSRAAQELLQDKSVFAGYVAAAHVPHPRTFRLASLADVDAVPIRQLDRVFIKPVNSQKFSDVVGVKGVWVQTRDALREAWARFHAQGFSVMAQEYVPGPATEHFFVDGFRDASGGYTGLFARRRMRMSPPDFGNSSCSRSIPLDDVAPAVRHVRRLLDGLDYRGIFSAEFKRDPRDGEFRILEVNTRAWTYVEFAARRGINVCDMAWRDAQGLPVPRAPRAYENGKLCVDLYHDLSCMRVTRGRRTDSYGQVFSQWLRADLHVFRFDDPLPALHAVMGMLRKRYGRSLGPAEGAGDILEGAALRRDAK